LKGYSDTNPINLTQPDNLAYVIYTSGSTGKPKGTLLPHQNVMRLFAATQDWYQFDANDVWSVFHSYAFDFSVWELFGALLYGAKAVVVPKDVARSPEDFHNLLLKQKVTVLNQTPSAFKQLIPIAVDKAQPLSLRYVVFGGEALDVSSLAPWFDAFGDRQPQLVNMYGITETTVHVTYRPISREDLSKEGVSPIGEVIPDLSWYLLDSNLGVAAPGCQGELHVGRAGLARGYHQRADLTALRFIPDPFDTSEQGGGRLYRTGDLARYRADGVIEYAGRIDHQVKIRGFRIELGEIEAQLQAYESVRDVVVIDIEGPNGKQLVGYLVAEVGKAEHSEQQTLLRAALRDHLKANLPDYMVPTHLLFLEKMPLTPNGKLDRKALPKPGASQLHQEYVAPQSELEQQIAAIWADVLKVDKVGLTDNFFELGGDSIISIQVVSRARQMGIRFTPKELFQHQTVQGLASVAKRGEAGALQIDQGPVIGEGMLLPIHQYFFDEAIPERHHWNQALLLKPGQVLEPELIDQALQALIVHHDALRLNFKQDSAGNWFANYRPVAEQQEVLWQSSVNSESELEALCSEAQSSLGLQDGPLIRAVLATLTDGTQRLLLAIHHLAVDGVSWRILLEDLQTAYGQLQEKQAIKLPEKTSSTRVWAEHLQTYASSEALQQELGYWKDQLADINACLPCDNTEGSLQGRHAGGAQTRLDQNYTRQLLQDAPSAYRTQINDLLLTTLARVISRWTQQDNVLVQLEGHGREELFDTVDLTRTVGWFTSMFPVKLSPSETLAGSIKQIKEQLRAIPNKGIGFGALRYLSDEASQQTLAELPVPRITFNYLGQFDSSFEGEAEEAAFLAPANESSGTSQSEEAPLGNWLSINGQVYSGELSLSWSFSREMFDETTVQKLASEYAEELKALIEHCSNEATSGLTPSDVPLARLSQEQLDALPISANEIEDIYPLSPMQQGMLFHSLFEQGGGDYINQVRVDVDGLDVERFHQAWQAVVDRHEVLRASFVTQFEQPLQVIRKQVAMPFVVLDWSTQADLAQNLDTWAEADRHKGFDLQQEPLLRIAAIRTGENSHHLIYTNHHILMDGWSNSQLLGEVLQSYAGDPLAHQASRYRDYIEWLQKQDKVQSEAFWRGQFGDLQEPTHLAQAIRQDKETLGQGYGDHYQVLDKKRTQALSDFARQQRVTVNTLVQAAWLLLLQRYTGQDTVAFGATVSGRPAELKGVEQQLGLFINTLPVIASPKPEQSVAQWIEQVQAQNLALREHEHTPLYDVQRWAGQGGEALFDNILVFENYPVSEALQQGASEEISFGEVANHEQTNYPLTLAVGLGEELSVHYSYDRSNFDDSAIERVAKHFDNLLGEITKQSQQHLGDLALLDAAEHQQIVYDWNRTEENYPSDQCIHQLIEARVDKTSDAIAVVFDNQELTYQQLNGKANQLAHKLRQLGVGPDVLVGIAVERSLEMVVGLLGILKAGGAYVPLDPEYPADRLAYMMEDSGIALLLTEAHLQAQLPIPDHVHCLMLDEDLKGYSDTNPINLTQPDNLAYVMYTSGSTGRPKGVAISHDALSQHAHVSLGFFNLSGDDRILQFATFNFDGFVEQLYPALICGASVVIRGRDIWDSETFYQELLARDISVVDVTTAYWFMLAKDFAEKGPRDYGRLHQFHSGGEAMPPEGVAAWKKAGLEHVHLLNTYGPTEATVTVSTHDCIDYLSGKEPLPALMPIGKVLPGRTIYLLDHFGKIVVNGAIGELTIGGELLARGYFNRPALTAERFIPDPFDTSEQGGGRLYRTGDLTRYLDDGVIEFVGRIDHQVKIRGFRIELGEIEAQLQAHEAVREAVVIDIEGLSGKQLVGYLVAAAGQAGDSEQQKLLRTSLRDHLRGNLPDYMVPAHLVFLEKMPLTPNGKLDRKALPKPDTSQLQQEYVAPQSELEQQIAAIWADVLKVEKVGLTDNFFELGGHSLLATQVISRVNHEWNLSVPLKALFVSENLGGFSVQVETLHAGAHSLGSELAKSLGDLKRLSLNELEQLIS
uniref:amino acid adenylation domain-containing protein n=1 Tax=Pseudomonas sp. LRF_L74 TaxID=3369422 RepID=UPI003F606BA9